MLSHHVTSKSHVKTGMTKGMAESHFKITALHEHWLWKKGLTSHAGIDSGVEIAHCSQPSTAQELGQLAIRPCSVTACVWYTLVFGDGAAL